jgi:hypothetical protein
MPNKEIDTTLNLENISATDDNNVHVCFNFEI